MKKLGYAGVSTVICLAFALPAMGQQPSAAEQACNTKYGTFYNKPDDMKLFDAFDSDATCKDSKYREGAFQLLAQKLVIAQKWKDSTELAGRFAKEFPNSKDTYVYSQALVASNALGDGDKMIEFGEKILGIVPDDINSTLTVATTIPENLPKDAAAKEKALDRAVALAKKLLAMMRPDAIAEKDWQIQVMGRAHGVLGFVHLQRNEFMEAETEYDTAVKINPKDQVSWYRYSVAAIKIAGASQKLVAPSYDEVNNHLTPGPERDEAVAKRDAIEKDYVEKRDKAVDILLSVVALPDPSLVAAGKTTLESIYKPLHKDSLDGLDELIAKRRAELTK